MTRLAALSLFLAGGPALALDPADCTVDHRRDGYGTVPPEQMLPYPEEGPDLFLRRAVGPVIDLGGGLVATPHASESLLRAEEGVFIDHCASGTGLRLVTAWRRDGETWRIGFDPLAVVRAAIASP